MRICLRFHEVRDLTRPAGSRQPEPIRIRRRGEDAELEPSRNAGTGELLEVENALEPLRRTRHLAGANDCPLGYFRRGLRLSRFPVSSSLWGHSLPGRRRPGSGGADEPRYAQIAHEMLDRFDSAHTLGERLSACVTPYLYGHPWLEKPALLLAPPCFCFRTSGCHDWTARLPSTTFAFIMVGLIYLHMRRFRPGDTWMRR